MNAHGPESFMRRALRLASRARERTWPNPMVGAVVVRDGRIVGEGYHHRAGGPHAEVLAIEAAGSAARGADLYVTLEPCHCHGKTGPCTNIVLEAGIRRVFVGTSDPNPRERGRSLRLLRLAGVEVIDGVLEQECRQLNRVYNVFIRHRRPYVLVKVASSLDGRIAARTGDSRWISSKAARTYAHRLRARCQAVMVGAGTVRADDPALDVRHVRGKNPAVAIIDSRLEIRPSARLFKLRRGAPVYVYTSKRTPAGKARLIEQLGAEVIRVPSRAGRIELGHVLSDLFQKGVYRLLVEGGSRIIGSLVEGRLADRFEIVYGGCFLGSDAIPMLGWNGVERVASAPKLENVVCRRLGRDVLVAGDAVYTGRE
ncbi:MAG: bifunctional diaminohydroxyphosphoribosylaminopyrimidine deaminase/5-amino-6-(5-phosphoribosylamino)uracil reductase RibD [Deltaproteobacteria bacterium]|nr:MAG: bifunctional diaminohydroxyphosphoribosylaminopyrimidine deaminase/5-amino-6-(5-phosphoribosylamino)uracil reductase RibD [Deltaproteobacteria bacterium]